MPTGNGSALGDDGALVESANLLPREQHEEHYAPPAKAVTEVALRLKYQIETVVPVELEEERVTKALSPIITPKVVQTAREAGDGAEAECIVFCLLVCKGWFRQLAKLELPDADLHNVRAVACEVIAKRM